MTGAADNWAIESDATDADVAAVLLTDPWWNGYSLADLEPPFRQYSRFAIARHPDRAPALLLLLEHPHFSVLIPSGDPAGVAALLAALPLPASPMLLAQPDNVPPFARYYEGTERLNQMVRMRLDAEAFLPDTGFIDFAPGAEVVELGLLPNKLEADIAALDDLYRAYPESAWHADQLSVGPFVGVRNPDPSGPALLAAAGTHAVAAEHGVAAIGNVYVRPEARRRGYGAAVTAGVVGALIVEGIERIILNVGADNHPARALYHRLGFRDHCPYQEGGLIRRDTLGA